MQRIKKYLTLIGVSAISLLIGKYVLQSPRKVEVREVIKFVEKKEESTRTKKKTVVREHKSPDGTTNTETVIVEDSNSTTTTDTTLTSEKTKIVSQRKLSLGLLAIKDFPKLKNDFEYGVVASIPLLGSLSAITMVDTTKRVGVGLSIEF